MDADVFQYLMLALARKVIILDMHQVDTSQLLGLAALILALGIVYWMMRERDDRLSNTNN